MRHMRNASRVPSSTKHSHHHGRDAIIHKVVAVGMAGAAGAAGVAGGVRLGCGVWWLG